MARDGGGSDSGVSIEHKSVRSWVQFLHFFPKETLCSRLTVALEQKIVEAVKPVAIMG